MGYVYRYWVTDITPLTMCLDCGANLTKEDSVVLELAVAGQTVRARSCLDNEGHLKDTEDRAVFHGFHSETKCGNCFESLVDYEEQLKDVKPAV
jgi:hypothetical protein